MAPPCQIGLRDTIVDELYEYKNLGVLKNYVGSFSSNVEDNIDRTRKKVGLIFASNFDRCKVNLLVYVKLWKQACLPSLLFGAELWTLTPTLLLKLEQAYNILHLMQILSTLTIARREENRSSKK